MDESFLNCQHAGPNEFPHSLRKSMDRKAHHVEVIALRTKGKVLLRESGDVLS